MDWMREKMGKAEMYRSRLRGKSPKSFLFGKNVSEC